MLTRWGGQRVEFPSFAPVSNTRIARAALRVALCGNMDDLERTRATCIPYYLDLVYESAAPPLLACQIASLVAAYIMLVAAAWHWQGLVALDPVWLRSMRLSKLTKMHGCAFPDEHGCDGGPDDEVWLRDDPRPVSVAQMHAQPAPVEPASDDEIWVGETEHAAAPADNVNDNSFRPTSTEGPRPMVFVRC
jgi:hypothetical protein